MFPVFVSKFLDVLFWIVWVCLKLFIVFVMLMGCLVLTRVLGFVGLILFLLTPLTLMVRVPFVNGGVLLFLLVLVVLSVNIVGCF